MCDYNHMRSPGLNSSGMIDHVSSLSSNLGELVENSEYSDITLVVEERRFQAHKVILAARSEYFRFVPKQRDLQTNQSGCPVCDRQMPNVHSCIC